MKFKNYCVVIMGNTKDVISEIEKISDTKPNVLDAKGIIISTFTSFVDIKEITEWLTLNNRSFLAFDLDQKASGVNITKKEIHDSLFGFLNMVNDEELNTKTYEFLKTINKDDEVEKNKDSVSLTEDEIKNLTKSEKENLINKIIETGVENLTDNDKKTLSLLVK